MRQNILSVPRAVDPALYHLFCQILGISRVGHIFPEVFGLKWHLLSPTFEALMAKRHLLIGHINRMNHSDCVQLWAPFQHRSFALLASEFICEIHTLKADSFAKGVFNGC